MRGERRRWDCVTVWGGAGKNGREGEMGRSGEKQVAWGCGGFDVAGVLMMWRICSVYMYTLDKKKCHVIKLTATHM